MNEIDIKLKEIKTNSRVYLIVSTLLLIFLSAFYFKMITNNENFIKIFLDDNLLFKISLSVVYNLVLLSYICGIVFLSLSLYRGEKFYGISEFREKRAIDLYSKKRHMFKAALISFIVFISAFFIFTAIISLISFI